MYIAVQILDSAGRKSSAPHSFETKSSSDAVPVFAPDLLLTHHFPVWTSACLQRNLSQLSSLYSFS